MTYTIKIAVKNCIEIPIQTDNPLYFVIVEIIVPDTPAHHAKSYFGGNVDWNPPSKQIKIQPGWFSYGSTIWTYEHFQLIHNDDIIRSLIEKTIQDYLYDIHDN